MTNFITLMKEMPGYLKTDTVNLEVIMEAQKKLGLEFACEYVQYLQEIGEFTARGVEFTGIIFSQAWNRIVESVVNETLDEREIAKEYGYSIPNDFYLIHNLCIGGILIWQNTKGEIYQTIRGLSSAEPPKKIYDSMNDYFVKEIYKKY